MEAKVFMALGAVQGTTSEDIADEEGLVCAIVNCRVWELEIGLQLPIIRVLRIK